MGLVEAGQAWKRRLSEMKTELTLVSSQPRPTPAQSFHLPRSIAVLSIRFVVLATVILWLPTAHADEPMQKFVEALRDRGYFDVAIEYLDQVNAATLSSESRQRLPLEKATTYRLAATNSRDLRQADTLLSEAQKAIANYQPDNLTDVDASATARFQGDLALNRARVSMARISGERISDTQRNTLIEETRSYLNASRKAYATATKRLASALKNFQIDPDDSSSAGQLTRLRAQYTYLKTRGPTVNERLAETWEDGSADRKQLLEKTAAEAKTVWGKYRNYKPALESCLTAARCFQELGKLDDSQAMVNEIFSIPRAEISSIVRREALAIAAANWQATEPFPWETVITETEAVVKLLTDKQTSQAQWQAIQLVYARALHEKSNLLSAQSGSAAKREAKQASENAIELAQAIAKTPGDVQQQAINLLNAWNVSDEIPSPEASIGLNVSAESFSEAERQGKAIVRDIESLLRQIAIANNKVRQSGSATEKQQALAEKTELQRQQAARSDAALKLFNQAIMLADKTVTRPQINNIRYLQCYCYFARQQFIESSVIAEFLLDKYPNVAGTRQAAAILLRTQAALFDKATGDKVFEKQQLIEACKTVLDRYPDTSEASTAAASLAQLALVDSDFDQAKTWFEKIPAGDPQRATLALGLGRKLWFDWSKANADGSDVGRQQLVSAKQYLTEGVSNFNAQTLTYAAAEGSLLLAQALLASGEVDGAIQRLESDELAPLKLIEPAHPTLVTTGRINLYHQEAALTAIKAYMTAMSASQSDQQTWIDKSGQVVEGLQERLKASGKPEDMQRLTGIYRMISRRLIDQFDSLAAGPPRTDFASRLASFLSSIENETDDARTIVWAGSTLLSVANTLQLDGAKAQAEPIYKKAVSALDRAEELGFGSGKDAAAMARELKRQRALAQRGAGAFDAAINQFTQLLSEKAGDLSTQLDAAMTLQQKGAAQNDAKSFAAAILGASPIADAKTKRKQNAIWGWRKLVLATRGKDQFASAFYQSLYHMIEARYEIGRINQSAEGVKKALAELDNWQKRNPNFDNGPWKLKFDQLRKRIEKQ